MPSLPPHSAWEEADRATRRLLPRVFAGLPPAIRDEAARRGCTVPQADGVAKLHNAVRGRFRSASAEWALLCSRDRVSAILVCRAAEPLACEEIAASPDIGWLQMVAAGRIGFSRILATVPAGSVPDGTKLPHDGIDDSFDGKASEVWWWDAGRWKSLPGAD